MNEISFTPGRLAKKIGISRSGLLQHLRKTGLIDRCFRSPGGHLKIPYSVALSLVTAPEALAVQTQTTRTIEVPRRQKVKTETANNPPSEPPLHFVRGHGLPQPTAPDYVQLAKTFKRAGISLQDMINYYYQQREVAQPGGKNEPEEDNFARTDTGATE